MRLVFGLLVLLVTSSGCNFREDKVSLLNDPQDRQNWYAWLNRNVIQPKCLSCHAGSAASAGIDLSSYAKTMESGSVVAGDPQKSSFYLSVAAGRMPKGGRPLSTDQLQFIQEWITKGAKETAADVVVIPPPDPEPTPTWDYIGKYIVERRCVGCHAPPKPKAGVDLSKLETILADGVVIPGDAEGSVFYQQIDQGLMPPKPPELTAAQKKAVKDWIQAGAKSGAKPPAAPAPVTPVPPTPPAPVKPPVVPAPGKPAPTWAYVSTLLQDSCVKCHKPPKPKAGVDLSTYEILFKDGNVVAGDPDKSVLFQQIDQDLMPPSGPLAADQKEAVKEWIKQGAVR